MGVVESLDSFAGQGIGGEIVQFLFSKMAAYYLRFLTVNVLRGFHQMLSGGIPNGPVPAWCTQGADGRATMNTARP